MNASGVKTNATRLLTAAGLSFRTVEYEVDENDLSGVHVARTLGLSPDQVFKTLVLKGEKVGYFVCCVPVNAEVDLKKAARAAGDDPDERSQGGDRLYSRGVFAGRDEKAFPHFSGRNGRPL